MERIENERNRITSVNSRVNNRSESVRANHNVYRNNNNTFGINFDPTDVIDVDLINQSPCNIKIIYINFI